MDSQGLSWPDAYVENGEATDFPITMNNWSSAFVDMTFECTMYSPAGDWLTVLDSTINVLPHEDFSFTIHIDPPLGGPQFLEGEVTVYWSVHVPDSVFDIVPIHVYCAPGPIEEPGIYDTVASADLWDGKGLNQYVGLTASNHGEYGGQGIGEVNLDFVKGGVDCDEHADVYLYSGSPFVMIKRQEGVSITTSHYSTNVGSGSCWVPQPGYPMSEGFEYADGKEYDSLYTGRMANRDTTIWMERTYFAPRGYANLHNFVAVRTVIGAYATIHDSIAIGEVSDWDVPADAIGNIGSPNTCHTGTALGSPFVYLRGYTDTVGCTDNKERFAASVFVSKYPGDLTAYSATSDYWGASGVNARNYCDFDTITNEPPTFWWDSLYQRHGVFAATDTVDQGEMLVYDYINGLSIGTELVYWTVYVTGYETTDQAAVESEVAGAINWTRRVSESQCCVGLRGDVDQDGGIEPSLGDLTAMISKLFIYMDEPVCYEEANLDGSLPEGPGSLSLGDLVVMIDILFISLNDPPACP